MREHITRIEIGAKYVNNISRIRTQLNDAYRRFRLESQVPDAAVVLRCFVDGIYYYRKKEFSVEVVANFLRLIKSSDDERMRIILANLQNKLDTVERYEPVEITDKDIPF